MNRVTFFLALLIVNFSAATYGKDIVLENSYTAVEIVISVDDEAKTIEVAAVHNQEDKYRIGPLPLDRFYRMVENHDFEKFYMFKSEDAPQLINPLLFYRKNYDRTMGLANEIFLPMIYVISVPMAIGHDLWKWIFVRKKGLRKRGLKKIKKALEEGPSEKVRVRIEVIDSLESMLKKAESTFGPVTRCAEGA